MQSIVFKRRGFKVRGFLCCVGCWRREIVSRCVCPNEDLEGCLLSVVCDFGCGKGCLVRSLNILVVRKETWSILCLGGSFLLCKVWLVRSQVWWCVNWWLLVGNRGSLKGDLKGLSSSVVCELDYVKEVG